MIFERKTTFEEYFSKAYARYAIFITRVKPIEVIETVEPEPDPFQVAESNPDPFIQGGSLPDPPVPKPDLSDAFGGGSVVEKMDPFGTTAPAQSEDPFSKVAPAQDSFKIAYLVFLRLFFLQNLD